MPASSTQAKTIQDTSTKIRTAAAPLSAALATTLEVASKGIDPKLKSILGKVGRINSVADEINGTVLEIGTTVDQIFAQRELDQHERAVDRERGQDRF